MRFKDIYERIESSYNNHSSGYFNCIPFVGMERLERFIPGLKQSTYYLLTANSGVGKSKLMRNLFIQNPYDYVKNHPEEELKLDVLYFSLEESKEKIVLTEISKYLFLKYNLVVSIEQLQSVGRYNTISPEILEKIKEAEAYIDEFLDTVRIIDNVRNPTGIYKCARDFAMEVGDYYDKEGNKLDKIAIAKGEGEDYKRVDRYEPTHKKHFRVVICDHLKLLSYEKDLKTTKEVMNKYSSDYSLHLRDKLGMTVVNVQQQAPDKEKLQYTSIGRSIEEKLEPSLDGLGEHKLTQQDCNVALGLFAPNRYGISQHNGYDITKLRDFYRSLSILKNRDGDSNIKVPLFFNGASDWFKELPRVHDVASMRNVERLVEEIENRVSI